MAICKKNQCDIGGYITTKKNLNQANEFEVVQVGSGSYLDLYVYKTRLHTCNAVQILGIQQKIML